MCVMTVATFTTCFPNKTIIFPVLEVSHQLLLPSDNQRAGKNLVFELLFPMKHLCQCDTCFISSLDFFNSKKCDRMFSNILLTVFLINVYLITNGGTNQVRILSSRQKFLNRRNISRNLFFTRSRVFNERACSCMTEVSCSCCETAFMLFHMMNRKGE